MSAAASFADSLCNWPWLCCFVIQLDVDHSFPPKLTTCLCSRCHARTGLRAPLLSRLVTVTNPIGIFASGRTGCVERWCIAAAAGPEEAPLSHVLCAFLSSPRPFGPLDSTASRRTSSRFIGEPRLKGDSERNGVDVLDKASLASDDFGRDAKLTGVPGATLLGGLSPGCT